MESLKCSQQAQVFQNVVGFSLAWWIRFSISAVFSTRLSHSAILGSSLLGSSVGKKDIHSV